MSIYAVGKGWNPGIYDSYESFLKQIYKFDGVEFEKFDDLKSAEEYLKGFNLESERKITQKSNKQKAQKSNQVLINEEKPLYPYVLIGSHISDGLYGFGGFIKNSPSSSPLTFKGFGDEEEMYSNYGLLAGEMLAIVNSINKAISMGLKQINIYYNNHKIMEFDCGFSVNDLKGVKNYKLFMIKAKKNIKINLIEIKTKSQDSGANLASKLARDSLNFK